MNRILEYLSILPSLSHHLFRIIINFNDLSFPFAKEHVAAKIEGEGRGGGRMVKFESPILLKGFAL